MIKAKMDTENVIPIWQPVGYSTYQITSAVAEKYGLKATHTGVLDPLAEGVIIVLLGDLRFQKNEYSSLQKEYEFDLVFGMSTDTYDGMGFITKENLNTQISKDKLIQVLESFEGEYTQQVPLYSARKVDGKKLFVHAFYGNEISELPTKSGKIFNISLGNFREEPLSTVIDRVIDNIKLVRKGVFRQQEIIPAWEAYKTSHPELVVQVATIRVQMSRGLYVRSLSQDIAEKLNTVGFISRLVRTRNGDYYKDNSLTFENIFGNDFDQDKLTSKYATLS